MYPHTHNTVSATTDKMATASHVLEADFSEQGDQDQESVYQLRNTSNSRISFY